MNCLPRILLASLTLLTITPNFSKAYCTEGQCSYNTDLDACLLNAVFRNDLEEVKDLLKRGATANAIYNSYYQPNWSALIIAASQGNIAIARELIAHGARVNVKTTFDSNGNPAIIFAARDGHLDMVKLLLAQGADIESIGHDKATPLIDAAYYGRTQVVEFLLKYGANINAQDEKGKTALMYAAYYGFYDVAKLLVEAGAHVNIRDIQGKTALYYARNYYYHLNKVAELLTTRGATE